MTTLGKNIIPDDAKRDAIHVAVASTVIRPTKVFVEYDECRGCG
jgi:hypothetical protein